MTDIARKRGRRDSPIASKGGAHRRGSSPVTHEQYLQQRYFAPLDGLRAVSILLVITAHATDPVFNPLHGAVGVTIFFVISGYLITTLLLREEEQRGHARIKAFYIRRAFRILPLYYVTLIAYIILIGVLHLQAGAQSLWHSLPWYATYQNDLAPRGAGIFGQTWSLAIEEKYYLVWPMVFVVPLLCRLRLTLAASLAALTAAASLWPETRYFAIYTPILLGCVMAIVLDRPTLYPHARRLANTPVALVLIAALIAWDMAFESGSTVHIVFSVLTVLLFPAILVGPRWLATLLSNRVAVYIGTRSYALYLIHRIGKGIADKVVPPGSTSLPHELVHFVLIVAVSLVGAEILCRLVEQPMIRLGRRLASTNRGARTLPAGVEAHVAVPAGHTADDQAREPGEHDSREPINVTPASSWPGAANRDGNRHAVTTESATEPNVGETPNQAPGSASETEIAPMAPGPGSTSAP
jgi:peptidoglycan/LPS O-acetylase OafA/YrhL